MINYLWAVTTYVFSFRFMCRSTTHTCATSFCVTWSRSSGRLFGSFSSAQALHFVLRQLQRVSITLRQNRSGPGKMSASPHTDVVARFVSENFCDFRVTLSNSVFISYSLMRELLWDLCAVCCTSVLVHFICQVETLFTIDCLLKVVQ